MVDKSRKPDPIRTATPAPGVLSVVVVEDDPPLRETMSTLIQQTDGFSCAGSFADAENALEGIPALKPDVVLMDIGLPGMSGIECAQRLNAAMPGVPIVMLTVYD